MLFSLGLLPRNLQGLLRMETGAHNFDSYFCVVGNGEFILEWDDNRPSSELSRGGGSGVRVRRHRQQLRCSN